MARINWKYDKGTTIFSGLKAAMDKKGGTINYSANGVYADSTSKVDAAIVVVGEDPYAESNGDRSASQLKLPASDISTIKQIENSHPDTPIILVLTTGRPIAIADYVMIVILKELSMLGFQVVKVMELPMYY